MLARQQPVKAETPAAVAGSPSREPVLQQDLEKVWKQLCENAAREKRIGLHTAMNAAKVQVEDGSVIGITVGSITAEHELTEHMLSLLESLRSALHNNALTHRITVNASVRQERPYTPREKYDYLRKKNPLIENMRTELDLNIDF